MPTAEIITIGTEILLGEIVDTNTRYLARTLRDLGIDLYRTTTIGDNIARIAETLRAAMDRAQIILTTGGLGPTVDDPTREAVARALGVALEYHPELWEQITARVSRYGRSPTKNQKRQAYLPKGAIPIPNPVGTAPGFIAKFSPPSRREEGTVEGVVIALPGVPREMEYLFEHTVIPYLQQHFALHHVIKVRTLHTAGVGESWIDERIGDLENLANPTVGLAAHAGIVDVRITAKAENEAEARRMIAEIETLVRERLGTVLFGADDETLEEVTLRSLARRGWNLAALESGLEGALARRLRPLGVPVEEVSPEESALAPALEALRERHQASVALGIVFRPGEELLIEQGLLTPQGTQTRRLTYGGHPRNVPRWAVNTALDWLRHTAEEE
ncbi:MAG: competence/damage-inducible protein A [Anaerolineae bacterium]|nr:MAG: competence/damage-inducible protein A [Anaerolineae bacterium]